MRQVHEAAVFAGMNAAQLGKINVLALEGNPGIGKTTAVMQFLKQRSQGFLFLYLSPRVVINRDVTDKLARNNGRPTGILTLTSNANLIVAAPEWYENRFSKTILHLAVSTVPLLSMVLKGSPFQIAISSSSLQSKNMILIAM